MRQKLDKACLSCYYDKALEDKRYEKRFCWEKHKEGRSSPEEKEIRYEEEVSSIINRRFMSVFVCRLRQQEGRS